MVADSVNHLVRTGIIIIVIIHVTGTVCHDQHRISKPGVFSVPRVYNGKGTPLLNS